MKAKGGAKYFPVVCVGGSAGGLDAYTRLLQNMPESAIASGCIDYVLSPEDIAQKIIEISNKE